MGDVRTRRIREMRLIEANQIGVSLQAKHTQ